MSNTIRSSIKIHMTTELAIFKLIIQCLFITTIKLCKYTIVLYLLQFHY